MQQQHSFGIQPIQMLGPELMENLFKIILLLQSHSEMHYDEIWYNKILFPLATPTQL